MDLEELFQHRSEDGRIYVVLLTLNGGSHSPSLLTASWLAAASRAIAYSREHFEDPPEVRDWTWTA